MTPEEFEKKREEARAELERGFIPKAEPAPPPPPPEPIPDKPQPILHTLKSDLASTIKDRNLSMTQIALEEQARRAERPMGQVVETSKKTLVIVVASILILLGAGAAAFTYYYIHRDEGGNQVQTPSLLAVDVIKPFKIGDVRIEVSRQDLPINTVEELAFGFSSPKAFFDELGVAPPGRLVRFLNKEFLVGVYSFDGPSAFLLFTTNDFQTTFAGMLDWEPKMLSDLGLFFPLRGAATTTTYVWRDRVIQNIDTRVLTDPSGKMRLLWAFLDKGTVLITDKESTFSEILRRFKTPR